MIPERLHRCTLKDGDQSQTEPLAKDNHSPDTNGQAKAFGGREKTVVE